MQILEMRMNGDPQSKLNSSFAEAQKIIEDYSATGIIRVKRDGTAADVEFVTCKTVVGEWFENGEWHSTKLAAIHHEKRYLYCSCKGGRLCLIRGNFRPKTVS